MVDELTQEPFQTGKAIMTVQRRSDYCHCGCVQEV